MKKVVIICSVLLVLLSIFAWFVKGKISSILSIEEIEKKGSKLFGFPLKIQERRVGFDGSMTLRGVVVGEEKFLESQSVTIWADLFPLLQGKFMVRKVSLDSPSLHLSRAILKKLQEKQYPSTAGKHPFPVTVRHGTVVVDLGKSSLAFRDVRGSLTGGQAKGNQPGSSLVLVKLYALLEGRGRVRVEGEVEKEKVRLSLDGKGIALETLRASLFPEELPGMEGDLALSLKVSGSLRSPAYEGTMKIDRGRIKGWKFQELSGNVKGEGRKASLSPMKVVFSVGTLTGGMSVVPERRTHGSEGIGSELSLHGEFHDLDLSRLSIPNFQVPLEGKISGKLSAFSSSHEEKLSGEVTVPKGSLKGITPFESLSLAFLHQSGLTSIRAGKMLTPRGLLAFSGMVTKGGGIDLTLTSGNVHLSDEPFLKENSVSIGEGEVEARVTGSLPALRISASTRFPFLQYREKRWEKIALSSSFSLREGEVKVHEGRADLGGKSFSFQGHGSWGQSAGKDRVVDLSFSGIPVWVPLEFSGVKPPFSVEGSFAGEMIFRSKKFSSLSLSGERLVAAGTSVKVPSLVIDSPSWGEYPFHGTMTAFGFPGTLEGSVKDGKVKGSLKVTGVALERVSLVGEAVPGLGGVLTGQVSFSPHSPPLISVSLDPLSYKGRRYPGLHGSFSWTPPVISLPALQIPALSPPVALTGSIHTEKKTMNLQGSLMGNSISSLASLLGFSVPGIEARLVGPVKITGSFQHPVAAFKGKATSVAYKGMQLGPGDLTFSVTPAHGETNLEAHFQSGKLRTDQLKFLAEALPSLQGDIFLDVTLSPSHPQPVISAQISNPSYKGKGISSMAGVLSLNQGGVTLHSLQILQLSPPVVIKGEIRTTEKSLSLQGSLQGQKVSEMASAFGFSLSRIEGKVWGDLLLSGHLAAPTISLKGSVRDVQYGESRLGGGDLDLLAIPEVRGNGQTVMRLSIAAKNVPVEEMAMLQKQLPGLSGRLEANVNTTLEFAAGSAAFLFAGGTKGGKPFPAVSGTVIWNGSAIQCSPINLPSLAPPLAVSGSLNSQTKQIALDGALQGQSLSSLLTLFGATAKGMDGNLSGPLSIRGSFTEPLVTFRGKMTRIVYKGANLGSGDLTMKATPQMLDGVLLLNPVGLPSVLGQIFPNLGGMQVEPKVYIKGTPQNPQITVASGPGASPQKQIMKDVLQEVIKGMIFKRKIP